MDTAYRIMFDEDRLRTVLTKIGDCRRDKRFELGDFFHFDTDPRYEDDDDGEEFCGLDVELRRTDDEMTIYQFIFPHEAIEDVLTNIVALAKTHDLRTVQKCCRCDNMATSTAQVCDRCSIECVTSDDTCPICQDDDKRPEIWCITTKCNHVFHYRCLSKWTRQQKKDCPMCRQHGADDFKCL